MIFQYPFAEDGDRNTDLPNAASSTGLVSFQEGFTPIYETLPSLGGQYIKRRDFNEIIYRICAGVNTLDGQGNKILANLNTAIGDFKLGQSFYCVANENIYLLINNTSVTEESTLSDLISAGRVKNITPLGQGQTWQDVIADRTGATTYTNTTGRIIVVSIVANATGAVGNAWGLDVDGLGVARGIIYSSGGNRAWVCAAVPAGSTYRLAPHGASSLNIIYWYELR